MILILAMKKMATSNVLIVGLRGLGAEIGNMDSYTLKKTINLLFRLSQKCCPSWSQIGHYL